MNLFLRVMVVGLSIAQAQAQPKPESISIGSLDEILQLSIENNPSVDIYKLNQEKAAIEYKMARASFLQPSISGVYSGLNNIDLATTPIPGVILGQPGETVDVQFGQAYNHNAGITFSQPILNWQSVMQTKIAKINLEKALVQSDHFIQSLTYQTSLYYHTALIARQAIALAESDFEYATQIHELNLQKYKEGIVDLLAVNNAEINKRNTEISLNYNRKLFDQSIAELKKLLGMPINATLELNAEIPYSTPAMYSLADLGIDKEVKLSSLNEEQAIFNLKKSQANYLPKISLEGYLGRQQFRDDFGLSFNSNDWSNYSYVQLSINIPIYTGLASNRKTKAAQLDKTIAAYEHDQALTESEINDAKLISEYNYSLLDNEKSQNTLTLYEENLALTAQKYEDGLISMDQYLRAFEDYLKAESNYLNSLSNSYQYYSEIISRSYEVNY